MAAETVNVDATAIRALITAEEDARVAADQVLTDAITSEETARSAADEAIVTSLAAKADLVGGVIPTSQIPALAITEFLGTVASQAAMLALAGQRGDWCVRTDLSINYVLNADNPTILANWTALAYPGAPVSSVNGQVDVVVLGAADVGADASGSAAAAQAAAIAASPAETTTTTGALINGATAKTTPVDADFVGLMDSAASNVLKKLSWANIKATLKAYFDTLYAPLSTASFLTYTGGSQSYAVTTLAAINSTTFTFPSTGLYHVQYTITHDANATTTGGNFGVAGTAVFDYLNWTVVYRVDAATAGRSVMTQVSFLSTGGVGLPAQSSANTTNNRVSVDIWINVTTVGNVSLLAASEVAVASGITVTDVTGFMKKEG